jgi:hypothetical protein
MEERMKHKTFSERGQALILIVFGIIGLLGMTALAVDGGMAYTDRRHAQNAADTAALAAAVSYVNGDTNWQSAADTNANKYGYNDDGANAVTIHNPPDGDFCTNLLAQEADADCTEYIQVVIESHVPTTFGKVVAINEVVNKVEAIARAVPVQEGSESQAAFFDGYAMVALDPTSQKTVEFNGNSATSTNGGGIYLRSNHDQAFYMGGNGTLNGDTGLAVVGGARFIGNITVNMDIMTGRAISTSGNIHLNGTETQNATIPIYPDPPTYAPPTVTPPSCVGTGTYNSTTRTLTPGNHPARTISGNGAVTMQPGNYCFSGNFTVDGNFTVTANNVAISMLTNKNLTLNGNLTFDANNSLIYLDSGSVEINGNANINVSNTPIYQVSGNFNINGNAQPTFNSATPSTFYLGSGSWRMNGNSSFTSHNIMYYLGAGSMQWNGNNNTNITAPTSGAFKGLLLYMPPTNSTGLTFNGNSGILTTGTILAPGATITINGNSGTTALSSQLIGWKVKINGNASTSITFSEGQNFSETQTIPAVNGRIELIK